MRAGFMTHALGIGDHVVFNGMTRRLLVEHQLDTIYVTAWHQYQKMVEFMFRDDNRIKVVGIPSGGEYQAIRHIIQSTNPGCVYILGHEVLPGQPYDDLIKPGMGFYQVAWTYLEKQTTDVLQKCFYDFMEIDWKHRFISCYYSRDMQQEDRVFNKLNPDNEDYIFILDDASRGHSMNMDKVANLNDKNYKVIYNDKNENMFYFGTILQNAKQVHVMESSLRSLIEVLPMEETELYYHQYIRNTDRMIINGKINPIETRKPWQVIL